MIRCLIFKCSRSYFDRLIPRTSIKLGRAFARSREATTARSLRRPDKRTPRLTALSRAWVCGATSMCSRRSSSISATSQTTPWAKGFRQPSRPSHLKMAAWTHKALKSMTTSSNRCHLPSNLHLAASLWEVAHTSREKRRRMKARRMRTQTWQWC